LSSDVLRISRYRLIDKGDALSQSYTTELPEGALTATFGATFFTM